MPNRGGEGGLAKDHTFSGFFLATFPKNCHSIAFFSFHIVICMQVSFSGHPVALHSGTAERVRNLSGSEFKYFGGFLWNWFFRPLSLRVLGWDWFPLTPSVHVHFRLVSSFKCNCGMPIVCHALVNGSPPTDQGRNISATNVIHVKLIITSVKTPLPSTPQSYSQTWLLTKTKLKYKNLNSITR